MARASAIKRPRGFVLLGIMLVGVAATAHAGQKPDVNGAEEGEHTIVFELGAAGDWSPTEGFQPGGTFAFEVTPIENWLELEIGLTAVRAAGSTEIPADVLFKKPWQFSPQFEFMLGVGPELVHATGLNHETFWGIESVLDFMFWPHKNVGWYVEPGYEVTFRDRTSRHGLEIAAGLLIGR